MLIDHIDRAVAIDVYSSENITRQSLLDHGLIRPENPHSARPRATVLTDKGREVVCMILGDYADNLVRAGYHVEKRRDILPSEIPDIAVRL